MHNQFQAEMKMISTPSEDLDIYLRKWNTGCSDINDILNELKSSNFEVKVCAENHIQIPSLKKAEYITLTAYSHDTFIKLFIVDCIDFYKNNSPEYANSNWCSKRKGDKIVLCNFAQIPTGNCIASKYVYLFNYYEIETTK